jgi:hypothetical protein
LKKLILYIILGLILFGLPFIAYTSEEYNGAGKCKVCHIKIFKSWQETPHAKAMDSLMPGAAAEAKKKAGLDPAKDYSNDPACMQCHTTGNNPAFAGIQCEACHGPGVKYSAISIMNKSKWNENPDGQRKLALAAGLVLKPEEKSCKTCHNEKSPTFKPFDYKARYELIKHPK